MIRGRVDATASTLSMLTQEQVLLVKNPIHFDDWVVVGLLLSKHSSDSGILPSYFTETQSGIFTL